MKNKIYFLIIIFLFALMAGCEKSSPPKKADIVVTNTYLQSAVLDLSGNNISSYCLSPPGMCPGHFDITPRQAQIINHAEIMLQFGFQKQLNESTQTLDSEKLRRENITAPRGMCVPESYIKVCEHIAEIIIDSFPEKKELIQKNLSSLRNDLKDFADIILQKIKNNELEGKNVVCSIHQQKFCEFLGFNVIASFTGSDLETGYSLNELIKKAKENQIDLIIANRPEGTKLAETLSDHLKVKMAVFENFPKTEKTKNNFQQLLQTNLNRLLKASK